MNTKKKDAKRKKNIDTLERPREEGIARNVIYLIECQKERCIKKEEYWYIGETKRRGYHQKCQIFNWMPKRKMHKKRKILIHWREQASSRVSPGRPPWLCFQWKNKSSHRSQLYISSSLPGRPSSHNYRTTTKTWWLVQEREREIFDTEIEYNVIRNQ